MERSSLNAYAELVDGFTLPAHLAGHPALDFCNTRAGWGEPEPGEFLKTYDHLVVWSAGADLISEETAARLRGRARRDRAGAGAALKRAFEFRSALYEAVLDPVQSPAWRAVAFEAESAAAAADLRPDGGRGRWVLSERLGFVIPMFAIAREAADLLTSPDLTSVRACPGRECGWLFLDRTGRRRWCTMAVCGNRSKVRRFTERRRGDAVSSGARAG